MFCTKVVFHVLQQPARLRMPFYAVAKGHQPGIYLTWPNCSAQVHGFKGARYKKFDTELEAKQFISQHKSVEGGVVAGSTPSFGKRKAPASAPSNESSGSKRPKQTILLDEVPCEDRKMVKYGEHSFWQDGEGFVHCYTDGSCEGNGKSNAAAGLGVYFAEGHALNTAKPVSGRATNNCGEIQAASLAIQLARGQGIPRLVINTDSKFLIDSITKWVPGWKRRNWKLATGGPVKNMTDFVQLDRELNAGNIAVKWNYVQAHRGIVGNERADMLARQGSEMYRARQRAG